MRKKQLLKNQQALLEKIAALQAENLRQQLLLSELPEQPPEQAAPADPDEEQAAPPHRFSRFPVLRGVDVKYEQTPPLAPAAVTLRSIAAHLPSYAAAHLGLHAKQELFACLLAAMACCDVIILHDESARLPQAVAAALSGQAELIAVRPSWRGSGDLLGAPDAVSKLYHETRLLRVIYETHYQAGPCFAVLEDLTAAPPEDYLSALWPTALMTGKSPARALHLANEAWPGDPRLLENGVLPYPENFWLFGTLYENQPQLPAAMADCAMHFSMPRRYLDETAPPLTSVPEPLPIAAAQLRDLFAAARNDFPLPEPTRRLWVQATDFLAERFDTSVGAFAETHLRPFASVCMACGMKPAAALDAYFYHVARRRLACADPALLQLEAPVLERFWEEMFGRGSLMAECASQHCRGRN